MYSEQKENLIQRLNVPAESQVTAVAPVEWEFDTVEIEAIRAQVANLPFIQSALIIGRSEEIYVDEIDEMMPWLAGIPASVVDYIEGLQDLDAGIQKPLQNIDRC